MPGTFDNRAKQGRQQQLEGIDDDLGQLLEHLRAREDTRGEDDDIDDDGNGHTQRGDNAAPVRPRLHPGRLLRDHGAGDAEVADVAGNEGHVCPGHADDRKVGNGLHEPDHPNGARDAKNPLRIAENGGISPNLTASTRAGEKQRTSAVQLVMRPHLMMKGRYFFSYMT